MARIILATLSIFIFVSAATICGFGLWLHQEFHKNGPLNNDKIVHIQSGTGLKRIAAQLEKDNIISSAFVFTTKNRLYGEHKNLQAGEYMMPAGISMKGVQQKLLTGDTYHRSITVPEGLTSVEIVELINNTSDMREQVMVIPAQGTLLPETYFYDKNVSRLDVMDRMQKSMSSTLDKLWDKRTVSDDIVSSPEEAIILASIIQKEAGNYEEMPRVAGVFANRLQKNMRLQSDPTVIFAITNGDPEREGYGPLGRRITRKDWEFESPYNTYKYTGLPPGPICHPSKESIKAALNPEKHDYLFFVASGDGGHAFAKTLSEHNRNVAKWRRVRNDAGKSQ